MKASSLRATVRSADLRQKRRPHRQPRYLERPRGQGQQADLLEQLTESFHRWQNIRQRPEIPTFVRSARGRATR